MEQHLDLNRVRLFVEVVERGSFTAAAEALGLPKSSVSRGVARLEEDLGVTLLRRTTRSLTLTDAGHAYAERARAALGDLLAASDLASDAGDEPRGLVRMTAPIDATGELIAAPIAKFLAQHPKIEIDLTLTGRAVDLVAEGFDLAIRAGALADSTLIARKVAESRLGIYAAPSYLDRRGRPRKVADLARHDTIAYRQMLRWTLVHAKKGETETVDVAPRLRCDEMIFAVQAVTQGVGIALIPVESVGPRRPDVTLERVLPEWSAPSTALWLVHPPMRHLPRRVVLLRDFLLAELRERVARCEAARATRR